MSGPDDDVRVALWVVAVYFAGVLTGLLMGAS